MRLKKALLLLILIISTGSSINFRITATIPSGGFERGYGFDTDHDGKQNLVFCSDTGNMQFWEYHSLDNYFLEDTATWSQLYDIGYLDGDSLVDMIGNRNGLWPYPLYVYESPAYDSNPTNIVWQDSGFENIYGGYITDLDHDGSKEILFRYSLNNGSPRICIYENTSNNQYVLVWQDTLYGSSYFTNGDFDLDGKIEFITGNAPYGWVYVWECVGNNNYQFIFSDTLPWANNTDIFSANDMDNNGKSEFLFTSVHYFYGIAWLHLYESTSDNQYDFFLVDSITNIPGSMFEQRSCCGDIDADGNEEVIWSTFNQWHIYKAFGVHQYQNIFSSIWTQHDATRIYVNDLNGNGYPEVIDSWSQNGTPFLTGTTIWEIEGVRLHRPNGGEALHPNQQYAITWDKFDPPGADSFALFFSSDSGCTYDTIITGLASSDTSFLWTVPNVLSDYCKIMIWAYGPPRQDEDTPRGTAWDFSDSVFAISNMVVESDCKQLFTDGRLEILQNPVIEGNLRIQYAVPKTTRVKLAVYNSLGQIVEVLVDEVKEPGIYDTALYTSIINGIYFVNLMIGDKIISKKCIVLRNI